MLRFKNEEKYNFFKRYFCITNIPEEYSDIKESLLPLFFDVHAPNIGQADVSYWIRYVHTNEINLMPFQFLRKRTAVLEVFVQ